MPPPCTPRTLLLQSHHKSSLTSSSRVINGHNSCYHNLTRIPTRPTRSYRHHRHNPATYPFLLHIHTQSFSTSPIRRKEKEQNYYEILDVPITASAAEIKKKFYSLSLRHHPDRNRTDPTASQVFAKISSAYSVLSNPQKRSTYDRDHGFHRAHTHHPTGSHSSHSANLHKSSGGGGYAGSRPASGLSNRRGTFRGPPPSFYEQGGYGETGRRGDGFSAGGGASAGDGTSSSQGTTGSRKHSETDPEDPIAFIHRNPLHHFNARGHFRTQKAEDERRRERISKARNAAREKADSFIAGGGFGLFRFVVVCGILVVAGGMTGFVQWPVVSGGSGSGKTEKKR